MHELGITDQLLTLALKHANDAGAARIIGLNLVVGEFSSVVDDSIQFYWDMMAEGTIAECATLSFERIPGRLQCADCEHTFLYADFEGRCPHCNGVQCVVVDGKQFQLGSIEVEG